MVRPMLRNIVVLAYALLTAQVGVGAEQIFPYPATVVSEQAEVRCGPGKQFYVTGIVKQNASVVVHRHDHGGWYMIAPPPGSFSWIESGLVERLGSNRGVVTLSPGAGHGSRAVVRIGSQLSDEHAYYGRELSNGDEVVIMGEKKLNGPRGPVAMLKIAPPTQEFRWVKGESLVPQNQQVSRQMAADPYQIPPQHRQRLVAEGRAPIVNPIVEGETKFAMADDDLPQLPALANGAQFAQVETSAVSDSPSAAPSFAATKVAPARGNPDFIELDQIDREYAAMTSKDPREWKLEGILKRYRDLANRTQPNVRILVDQRIEVAEKRHEIAERYQRFIQVSAETARRDAELLASQSGVQTAGFESEINASMGDVAPAGTQVNSSPSIPLMLQQVPQVASSGEAFSAPTQFSPASMPTTTETEGGPIVPMSHSMEAPTEMVKPALNGAGVLHYIQGPAGFPAYGLVAPDGRLLAYVSPEQGVLLTQWLGKPVGIVGRRAMDPALGRDHIHAQKLVPIQLAP